jgi:hypothetical protein
METDMFFAALMTIGIGLGLVMGALSHPKIYAGLTGARRSSADFNDCARF